jgi:hypothetical protein
MSGRFSNLPEDRDVDCFAVVLQARGRYKMEYAPGMLREN